MRELLKSGPKRLLGVDLAEHEIRLVEVTRGDAGDAGDASAASYVKDAPRVSATSATPLPDLATVRDAAGYIEVMGAAVREAARAAGALSQRAVIAVSGDDMMQHEINVPAPLEGEALEARVATEAASHFPLPAQDVALDFIVLSANERAKAAPPDTKSVLMVACPVALLEMRRAALAAGGLQVVCVDVDLFALERTYALLSKQLPEGAALAAAHLAPHGVKLYLAAAGSIHLSAEVPRAAPPTTGVITGGGGALALAESAAEPWQYTDITARIRTAADAAGLRLTQLLADGVALGQPEFVRQLESETGLRLPAPHPLAEAVAGCGVDQAQLEQLTPKLVLACGLALRRGV